MTAPTDEPISNVPAAIAKRSQPGSVVDDSAADELVAPAPEGADAFEVAVVLALVLCGVATGRRRLIFKIGNAQGTILTVGVAVLLKMLDPVIIAALPMVERVVQEEEDGTG